MKTLVLFYSRTGSNKYLAERIATELKADMEEIHPNLAGLLFVIFSSLLRFGLGNKPFRSSIDKYERVVVVGPIYMGTLIFPLRNALKKIPSSVNQVCFATSCGGGDEEKDSNFGYTSVFVEAKKAVKHADVITEAFPIKLVVPKDKWDDGDFVMKTRLNDSNFEGEIYARFQSFIQKIKSA
ncbi:MAG: hypothetical protein RL266_1318 [Bacteroidota bacterium]|jgi:menaquinone-dependent protoporphyrinogen IX oxidase